MLIVDDDSAVRDPLAVWFREGGWQVRLVDRCAAAVSAAAQAVPDAAVLEQRLADGSGLDLLQRLRAISPGLSAVVLTRYPSIAAAVHAMRLGFRDYLAKPIDWGHLAGLFGLEARERFGGGVPANEVDPGDPCSLARIEWEHIQAVLFACRGNVSAAARLLGVHRRSLQRKLQRLPPAHVPAASATPSRRR